jgi:hypothetical protein
MLARRLHLCLGAIGVVAFLVTGQYMDLRYAHLRGMADAPRLLFRSAHIYLLFSSLLNLLLGIYGRNGASALRRRLQAVGSAFIIIGPFLFTLAFLKEPWFHGFERPFSRWAIYASFAGVLLHLAGHAGRRDPDSRPSEA